MLMCWQKSREWDEFEMARFSYIMLGGEHPQYPHVPRYILVPASPDPEPDIRTGADLFTD